MKILDNDGSECDFGCDDFVEYVRDATNARHPSRDGGGFIHDISTILRHCTSPMYMLSYKIRTVQDAEKRLMRAFEYLFARENFRRDLLIGRLAVGVDGLAFCMSTNGMSVAKNGFCSGLYRRGSKGYFFEPVKYLDECGRLENVFWPGKEGNALLIAAGEGYLDVMPWDFVLLCEMLVAHSLSLADWFYREIVHIENIGERLKTICGQWNNQDYEFYYLPMMSK